MLDEGFAASDAAMNLGQAQWESKADVIDLPGGTMVVVNDAVPVALRVAAQGLSFTVRDLDVIELSPLAFIDPGESEPEVLAYRLWRMQREALRTRFHAAGVPVVEWKDGDPLARPIEEVTAFRRNSTLARV